MKILAYTENYATETLTFIVNELKSVEKEHDLLFVYSHRINPEKNNLKRMICIPYSFNRITNKIRWWLEQSELYFPLLNLRFKKGINKVIAEFKPDIIHCHFGTDFLKLAANISDKYKNIPVLISFYGFDVTERICNNAVLRSYQKYMLGDTIHSIAVSRNLVDNINEFIKPRNQASIVHSGIDTDFFKRDKSIVKKEGEFIFLQVASFYQKKGHYHTLEVFRQFIDKDKTFKYKFIIAGFGPLKAEIESQIERLSLQHYVELVGPVSPQEMVELASRADCFVHMSITADNGEKEGLPNVLLEAMALELPILATRHAGIPEIVINGVHGILADEKDYAQYLESFEKIIHWKPLAQNRERIISLFGFDAHMAVINKLYSEIKKK